MRAPQMPATTPAVSPPTRRPYFSFRLSEPEPAQAINPASVPQPVELANHIACSGVGRSPKRVRPQAVPPPITAPAVPTSITTPGLSCCPSKESPPPHTVPAMMDVVTASAVPSGGDDGDDGDGGAADGDDRDVWLGRLRVFSDARQAGRHANGGGLGDAGRNDRRRDGHDFRRGRFGTHGAQACDCQPQRWPGRPHRRRQHVLRGRLAPLDHQLQRLGPKAVLARSRHDVGDACGVPCNHQRPQRMTA